jgi:hypothetical protein
MIISLENLRSGIEWWRASNWGMDIINSEYEGIYKARAPGLTQEWWDKTVDLLWAWKAIRSRKPPNTKAEIKKRGGGEQLARLSAIFASIRSSSNSEPDIVSVQWDDISELFEISFEIKCSDKKVGSPVFGSKMCHFIFPKVFPVIDNLATGIFDYEFYWRGMRDEWQRFPYKDEAIAYLSSVIESPAIHPLYPFETKIVELSHIGYAHALPGHSMSTPEYNKFNDPRG